MTRNGIIRGAIFTIALVAFPLMNLQHWIINMLVFVLMYAAMSSAWNLVGGFAGYPSLGHAAFFGIGAYTLAIWFQHHPTTNSYMPFIVLPVVGLIAAIIGLPVAWIAMRTRADVFAIVTITFLFVVQSLAFNLSSITGGSQGISLPTANFDTAHFERPFYYAMLVMLLFSMVITFLSMRSKFGLSLDSIGADEDKAIGLGVRTQGVKVLAFCVSVGIVAMVGGVWAYYQTFIYPQFAIDPLITIGMVLMTFLGGRATLWGPVLGAFILETAQQTLAYQLGGVKVYLIAYAVVFLLVMILLPRGIIPTIADRIRFRKRARGDSGPTSAPVIDASAVVAGGHA